MIEYKGYHGVLEFDGELGRFHGRVVDTRSVISFYGASVDELREEMAKSVDTYVAACEERGIEPEKPYSGKFVVRLEPELHRAIATRAAASGQSMNDWVSATIAAAVFTE